MNQLVLHHGYANGAATDLSGHGNHGVAEGTTADVQGALTFGGSGRVRVDPSVTLTPLRALRVQVTFQARHPHRPVGRHYPLVEGYQSFALTISQEGALVGWVWDQSGIFAEIASDTNLVRYAEWQVAELQHDGARGMRLGLDGEVVAEASDVGGPLRGAHGVVVGNWAKGELWGLTVPDAIDGVFGHLRHRAGRFASPFEGLIDDLRIWRYEPAKEPERLLDPCCIDRTGIDRLLDELSAAGWTPEKAGGWLDDFLTVAKEAGGGAARARSTGQAARRLIAAIRAGDTVEFRRGVSELRREAANEGRRSNPRTARQMLRLLAEPPFAQEIMRDLVAGRFPDETEVRRLARLFCVDGLLPAGWPERPAEQPSGKED